MLSLALLSFSVLLAATQSPVQPQVDPEQTSAGRAHFLGRRVAQTMHWRGASWLMRKTREQEENGVLLRKWLAVQPGQAICDLGCGTGYHTLPLAHAVGAAGSIYAVDLQPEMLVLLKQRSDEQQLTNIVSIEATIDDPKLPPASCDLVLMVDVYHELSHPVRVMAHVRRALQKGGRVVLVEFRAEDPDVPIKPEHMMSKAQVVREMAAHGFQWAGEYDALPWQHAMAFTPAVAPDVRFAPRQVIRGFLRAAAGDDPRIVAAYLAAGVNAADLPTLPADLRVELRAGTQGRLLANLRGPDGSRLAGRRDELVLHRDQQGRWLVAALRESTWSQRSHGGRQPFVAMHTATGNGSVAEQVALACELDFDGVAWSLDGLDAARHACESHGGDLISAYVVLDVADSNMSKRLGPVLAAMHSLAGGPGMLWLGLQHGQLSPRDAAGDEVAISVLQQILEHANRVGVEVALYPHTGFWLETVADALRLCERSKDPQLGVCFNLCHFLRTHAESDPTALLTRCKDRLFAVTVNGADRNGDNWTTLIRPLGEGDFDLRGLLTTLDAIGFDGPVGVQGYGISSPARELLTAAMATWRAAHALPR